MAAVNIYKQVRGRMLYKRIEYRLSVLRAFAEAGALSFVIATSQAAARLARADIWRLLITDETRFISMEEKE